MPNLRQGAGLRPFLPLLLVFSANARCEEQRCHRRSQQEEEEGLFQRVREHFEREHPKVSVAEEQLRGFVAHAYDVGYAVACSSGGRPGG